MNLSIFKKAAALALAIGAFGVIGVTSASAVTTSSTVSSAVTITATITPGPNGLVTDCGTTGITGFYVIGSHAASPIGAQATGGNLCVEVGSNVPWSATVAITTDFNLMNTATPPAIVATKSKGSFDVLVGGTVVGTTGLASPVAVATNLPASTTKSAIINIRSHGYTQATASTLPAGTYDTGVLTFTVTG